ncbi:MAG: rRNA (cytidine1920-2-O)/16S rRNA (cytidine1409-2-O)-methyltransferase [Patescibacteria group bacterium]|nr:rRNA (cytidine1920-2-O)/16S rRNA (cytidine1409-2-O)-methyltransferase [Patescibacteria group bacterium]
MNTVNVRNKQLNNGTEQDFSADFSRAYTKIRLFDQSVRFAKRLEGSVVLDVGSSTGGFTNFALEKGAKKVVAVEIGSRQMDPRLVADNRVKLYEKTDILNVFTSKEKAEVNNIVVQQVDFALMDVSFVSCRNILLHLKSNILGKGYGIVLLFKPQFEAQEKDLVNGVIKNSKKRRDIVKNFEQWLLQNRFIIEAKKDSELAGSKGNVERFYFLRVT